MYIKATKADSEELKSLYHDMWEEINAVYGQSHPVNLDYYFDSLILPSIETEWPVIVNKYCNRIISAIFWVKSPGEEEKVCLGLGTYTIPEFRNQGISNRLRDLGLEGLQAIKCKRLIVEWHQDNEFSGSWFDNSELKKSKSQSVSFDI